MIDLEVKAGSGSDDPGAICQRHGGLQGRVPAYSMDALVMATRRMFPL